MRWVAVFLTAAVVGACASDGESPTGIASSPAPSQSSSPSPSASAQELAEVFVFPTGPIPARAPAIAKELKLQTQLLRAIDAWLANGGRVRSPEGRAIALASLRRQKLFRKLTGDARLERRVLPLVPGYIARVVRAHTSASRGLSTLVQPVKGPIHLPTKQPDPPHKLSRFYKAAEERFGVQWQLLAAINLIETRFGRLKGASTAGAQGPMQFMPATWAAYGRGDVHDPYNAIMGAARYLRANGAPSSLKPAVFAYNHADSYVDAVLTYFRQIQRDERHFYSYYFWQVFVKHVRGDVQLTGPGGERPHII